MSVPRRLALLAAAALCATAAPSHAADLPVSQDGPYTKTYTSGSAPAAVTYRCTVFSSTDSSGTRVYVEFGAQVVDPNVTALIASCTVRIANAATVAFSAGNTGGGSSVAGSGFGWTTASGPIQVCASAVVKDGAVEHDFSGAVC
jgi:hypothetical protein